MRQMRGFALFAGLLTLLAGCGGGSGGVTTRTITIHVGWPAASGRKAGHSGRGITEVTAAQYVTIEAFDGVNPLGVVRIVSGGPDGTLTVPIKDLTFYAHAYAVPLTTPPADAAYTTNPATGTLLKNGQPLKGTDSLQPVGQAITTVTIVAGSTPTVVNFSVSNTIASIQPMPGLTSYPLNNGLVNLNNTVQALATDGGVLLVSTNTIGPTALQWTGPSDPLGQKVATVLNGTTATPQLQLNATGTAQVTVTDNEVSKTENQASITATITFTVTQPVTGTPPVTLMQTLALDTSTLTGLPLYTRSVTLQLAQNNLGGLSNDTPPVTPPSAPFGITTNALNNPVKITSVSFPTAPTLKFVATGRDVTLTVQAWSQADGTGALLASGPATFTQAQPGTDLKASNVALTTNVTGTPPLVLSPPNPTITLVNPGGASDANLNFVNLQAYAQTVIGGLTASHLIDIRALQLTLPSGVNTQYVPDKNGNWSLQVTPTAPLSGATLKVADQSASAISGSTQITAAYGKGGTGLTIN